MVSFTYFFSPENEHPNSINLKREGRKYFEGIIENLRRILALYPRQWNMRLYIDGSNDRDIMSICKIVCAMEKGKKISSQLIFMLIIITLIYLKYIK